MGPDSVANGTGSKQVQGASPGVRHVTHTMLDAERGKQMGNTRVANIQNRNFPLFV